MTSAFLGRTRRGGDGALAGALPLNFCWAKKTAPRGGGGTGELKIPGHAVAKQLPTEQLNREDNDDDRD